MVPCQPLVVCFFFFSSEKDGVRSEKKTLKLNITPLSMEIVNDNHSLIQ